MANSSLYLRDHPKLKSVVPNVTTTNQLYKIMQEPLLYQSNLTFLPIRDEELSYRDTDVENFYIDVERIDNIHFLEFSRISTSPPDKTIRFVGRMTLPKHDRFMYIYITAHFKYNINKHNKYGQNNRYGTVYYSQSSDCFFHHIFQIDKYFTAMPKNKRDNLSHQFSELTAFEKYVRHGENAVQNRPAQPRDYFWEMN